MSTARRRHPHSRAWLRVLVLLLALLVPGAQAQAAWPSPAVSSEESAGYDLPEVALRPPSLPVHRADVPLRPVPRPGPASVRPPHRPGRGPSWPPHAPRALRSVVLRC
jgi:hypothetical protein